MADPNDRGSDHLPTGAGEQVRAAFALADTELVYEDFKWLVKFCSNTGDVRLIQFTVYAKPAYGIYFLLHMKAARFKDLAELLEEQESHVRVPYRIEVLGRYYGSDPHVAVVVTYGPGV